MTNNPSINISTIISEFLTKTDETSIFKLISYSKHNEIPDNDILNLARGMAKSGNQIKLQQKNACDIPSTGGPASLSTLLCPIFLTYFGNKVIKLGVPGRPAGGVDVLATIKGYNINPSIKELQHWLTKMDYVHILADDQYAPLDALLFRYRREQEAVAIPSLAIASLLSKKIAMGINSIGLDVRVSKIGNFGSTWSECKYNSLRFNQIANLGGIKSTCFLTNGTNPQQPYIGRGEAILALRDIFNNQINSNLKKHVELCLSMASSVSINGIKEFKSFNEISDIFFNNIIEQGGSIESFYEVAYNTEINHANLLISKSSGFLTIDLAKIRLCILKVRGDDSKFPDTCGIILKTMQNEYIFRGDAICTYRCDKKDVFEFKQMLEDCFNVVPIMTGSNEFEQI